MKPRNLFALPLVAFVVQAYACIWMPGENPRLWASAALTFLFAIPSIAVWFAAWMEDV